jgi:predicted esterase
MDLGASERRKVECNGVVFDLSLTDKCARGGCGLIFDVHGWTMTGEFEDVNTGLARLGRENDFVVVQPNANNPPGDTMPSWYGGVYIMDVHAIVLDFLKQAMEAFAIDPARVHFTGLSQGGAMTWHFICNQPDLIASAAPIGSSGGSCFGPGAANPDVPVLYCHGRRDALSSFVSARATADTIVAGMGSGAVSEVLSQDAKHTWTRWTAVDGRLFEFIEHDYVGLAGLDGHCIPGSFGEGTGDPAYSLYGCYDTDWAFRWGEAVIEFFKTNHR